MTTVAIVPENIEADRTMYRAVAGRLQSVGKTAGEALDALTPQLDDQDAGTLVIVMNLRPDRFFTAQQQSRLSELMTRWRAARDAGGVLSPEEQTELDALTDTELQASAQRAEAMLRELGK